ncbi:hypothetical protein Adt_20609 [Abeliophyllum distichum]|uniref:Uncharacterized protein n=1 Tax=Abeliophyllum distichum TaxID=126358 RepID=A0ABD1SX45_9LAMI
MSSEVDSDSGMEAMSWGRGQEEKEEAASSGRMVEGIDEDEVLSPAPLTAVSPRARSSPQAETSGERVVEPRNLGLGRREAEFASGLRTAPTWKCKLFSSEVNEGQLREWHQMYRIPDYIEFVVPGPNDRTDDPPLGYVALNQAVLAAGLRLPFPRIVRKFLREWGIAPTQLYPQWMEDYDRPSHPLGPAWLPTSFLYVSQEPTEESSERARRAWDISENIRSSTVLIIEENLISARLSPSLSDRPDRARASSRPEQSLARSVEEITAPVAVRAGPSSSQAARSSPAGSQLQPTYLGSTPTKDEEFIRLRGTLSKPVLDFIRSNSPTREEIAGLPLSTRRAIRSVAKCWTPAQQKYLESMDVVDSVVVASVNVSRATIQLTSASEKMGRLFSDVQVMRDEGRKVLEEQEDKKRLLTASEDVLFRREEELRGKEAELRALAEELERANKSRADLEHDLEVERKSNAELRDALEKNAGKDEAVAEFRSSDAYLAEQEMVYYLTMEVLIETTVEKCPDWDVQFLRDELSNLKKKSTLNPPSPEEVDLD